MNLLGKIKRLKKDVRLAMAISFGLVGWLVSSALADEPLARVSLESRAGYVVSEKYASDHRADFVASLVEYTPQVDFWTPSATDVIVAERTLRELIHDGTREIGLVFPGMGKADAYSVDEVERERTEVDLVERNYLRYNRQFVGLVMDGRKVILCNFSDGPKVDPAKDYVFIQKVFVDHGMHFLQARFDMETKTCSKVSLIGTWQEGK
jgi:hypothetical protein